MYVGTESTSIVYVGHDKLSTIFYMGLYWDRTKLSKLSICEGIIEDDQIELAAFSLECFSYLTGLVTANKNAGSKSAKARRLIKNEPCYWTSVTWKFIKLMSHILQKICFSWTNVNQLNEHLRKNYQKSLE